MGFTPKFIHYSLIKKIPLVLLLSSLITVPTWAQESLFNDRYYVVFEANGNELIEKFSSEKNIRKLGIYSWQRIVTLFPKEYRQGIVQYNVMAGRRWAGQFSGDGQNDIGKPGYRLSVARYLLEKTHNLSHITRPITPRRGTLDWTLIHELGHYICLTSNAIELFSQAFDGDMHPQPPRRKRPMDYPKDGSPVTNGNFVTSYAERTPGDEEVVETFTTYMTLSTLPDNDSLVARKIRFFNTIPGFPQLRAHIQQFSLP